MVLVVDDAELSGRYAVHGLVGMEDGGVAVEQLEGAGQVAGCVPDLEGDAQMAAVANCRRTGIVGGRAGEPVEIVHGDVLPVGRLWIVAVADVEDVAVDVLPDDEPRAAAEAEALALSDGVEPVALVLSDLTAGLQLDDIANALADEAAHVVVVVDVAEEADALRVLAVGIDEMLALGDLAHLVLHIMADGEEGLGELPVVDLGKEVGLVLHGIGRGGEPLAALVIVFGLGIVAGGDEVVLMAFLLVEGAELDEAVAHHVGIGREAGLHLLHGVARHLAPVFLVAVDDLDGAAVLPGHGGGHLEVFLGGAVPLLLLLGTDHDVEAVGVEAQAGKLVHDDGTVDTAREEDGDALATYIFDVHCLCLVGLVRTGLPALQGMGRTACRSIMECAGQQSGDALQALLVVGVEGIEVARVDVEDGTYCSVGSLDGHDDLRAGEGAAGDVAGEELDVRHTLGDAGLPRCAADTASIGDVHAGDRTLEGSEHQFGRLTAGGSDDAVEAGPEEAVAKGVVQGRRRIGHEGRLVVFGLIERVELGEQRRILFLSGHDDIIYTISRPWRRGPQRPERIIAGARRLPYW